MDKRLPGGGGVERALAGWALLRAASSPSSRAADRAGPLASTTAHLTQASPTVKFGTSHQTVNYFRSRHTVPDEQD